MQARHKLPFIGRTIGYNRGPGRGPRGLGDKGIRAICFQVVGKHWYFFQGSWEQPHSSVIKEALQKVKMNLNKKYL